MVELNLWNWVCWPKQCKFHGLSFGKWGLRLHIQNIFLELRHLKQVFLWGLCIVFKRLNATQRNVTFEYRYPLISVELCFWQWKQIMMWIRPVKACIPSVSIAHCRQKAQTTKSRIKNHSFVCNINLYLLLFVNYYCTYHILPAF